MDLDDVLTTQDVRAQVLASTINEVSSSREAKDPDTTATAGNVCVICLDSVAEPCLAKPCGHDNFDYLCLVSWLQESRACPLCKAHVKEVRYDFTEDHARYKTYSVPAPATTSGGNIHSGSRRAYDRSDRRHSYRQPRQARRPSPPPTADEAILRRRHVYANQLYSLHVGSNRYQRPRYRELTPQLFATDSELMSRARKWIRRELQVFQFLSTALGSHGGEDVVARRRASNAEFLLEYIIAILKTVDIQGSAGQAEDMLQEFLGRETARLFLHELRAWLRSPYAELEAWDRNVQYSDSGQRSTGGEDGSRRRCGSRSRDAYRAKRWAASHYRPYPR